MDHFYMYLPSNSSQKFFQNNTLSHFFTQLSNRVDLDGKWEVGLSEIIYNASNTSSDLNEEELTSNNFNTLLLSYNDEQESVIFPGGKVYRSLASFFLDIMSRVKNHRLGQETLQILISELQAAHSNAEVTPRLPDYGPDIKTNTIIHGSKRIRFAVGEYNSVGELLNEIDSHIDDLKTRLELMATGTSILMKNINYFHRKLVSHGIQSPVFVYMNLIEPSFSGDVLAKTLRIINLEHKGGHFIFNPIYYHKLSVFSFENVEIALRYSDGELVNFFRNSEPTIAVIHFRRVRSNQDS